MRLLIVTSDSDRPEIEVRRFLVEKGMRVDVMCPPTEPSADLQRRANIRVFELQVRRRIDPRAVSAIRKRLQTGNYDFLHAPTSRTLAASVLAARGLSVRIVAYRGIVGSLSALNPTNRITFLSPRVERIVCCCRAVERFLAGRGVPEERLVTIYKGHDPDWYRPVSRMQLERLGIPRPAFVAGCAANDRPRKGLRVLVEALARLPIGSVHVLLAGHVSPALVRAVRRCGLSGVVHLVGHRPDAAALMGACDVFVMPSIKREGLPRALLESMSQSVPAVVTRVGGMPEAVQNGEQGYVVPPRNSAALAEAIQRLAGDRAGRRRMGAGARSRVQSLFHVAATAARTLQLYEDLYRLTNRGAGKPGDRSGEFHPG